MATFDVVVTKRDVVEQTLSTLDQRHGRGVVLVKLIPAERKFPSLPRRSSISGDLLRLAGAQRDVERVGRELGYIERPRVNRTSYSSAWVSWSAASSGC